MPMTTLIDSLETAARLLSAFKRAQEPGSDLHLLADDNLEASYAFLDRIALRQPSGIKPAADLTES